MCTLRTTFSLEGQALNGSLKADTEPAEQPRELSPVFCDDLEEWDGGSFKQECVYVYM